MQRKNLSIGQTVYFADNLRDPMTVEGFDGEFVAGHCYGGGWASKGRRYETGIRLRFPDGLTTVEPTAARLVPEEEARVLREQQETAR